MFEVGKYYTVKMWQDSDDGGLITDYGARKVVKVSLPLVTFEDFDGGEIIINAASLAFVSASKTDDEDESREASDEPSDIEPEYT